MAEVDKRKLFEEVKKSMTEMLSAANNGNLEDLKRCITSEVAKHKQNNDEDISEVAVINNFKEGNGRNCMHFAAIGGQPAVLEFLLEKGGDVNCTDDGLDTPLSLSVTNGHLDTSRVLIDKGASVNHANKSGATPLHQAASNGDVEHIKLLLLKGAKIDAPSSLGTPLMWAVMGGKMETAIFLLNQGASPNGSAATVPPPLILACSAGHEALASCLVKKGADVNAPDPEGWTPLHCAAESGAAAIVRLLLEAGADPNVVTQGKTALSFAVKLHHTATADLLRPVTTSAVGPHSAELPMPTASHEGTDASKAQAVEAKNRGNEQFGRADYTAAIESYSQAITLDPENAIYWSNRSFAQFKLGNYEAAVADATKAKSLDKKYMKAYFREGEAYIALGNYGDGAASFFEGLQIEPSNTDLKRAFESAVAEGKRRHNEKSA
eukprot:GILJ01003778.1.p1 GENE.GILJ01003778.1~~GILJ01003778.1.p1  ORF type:complete len:452 (+),score=86.34 GILJ01003778.1:48-1358(+)